MHEHIFAGCTLNKAVPLGAVEPLDCSLLSHKYNSFRLSLKVILFPPDGGKKVVALPCSSSPATKKAGGYAAWFCGPGDRFGSSELDCAEQKHRPECRFFTGLPLWMFCGEDG